MRAGPRATPTIRRWRSKQPRRFLTPGSSGELAPELEQRQRRLGGAGALVALAWVGPNDRLCLILDRKDAVADRQPVSSSATTAPDFAHTYEGKKPYVEARALSEPDIDRILEDYARAARNAVRAGFDGVQIHGANGYLVDQFLRDAANLRSDDYGGSIPNRIRCARQVLESVGSEIGMDKVGIRFSPNILSQGVEDSDPVALYAEVAKMLEELKVPWIELREPAKPTSAGAIPTEPVSPAMRPHYSGRIVINSDYDWTDARARIEGGHADAVSIGRLFIANHDLVKRLATGAPLNPGDPTTFYAGGAQGYTDYPALEEQAAA